MSKKDYESALLLSGHPRLERAVNWRTWCTCFPRFINFQLWRKRAQSICPRFSSRFLTSISPYLRDIFFDLHQRVKEKLIHSLNFAKYFLLEFLEIWQTRTADQKRTFVGKRKYGTRKFLLVDNSSVVIRIEFVSGVRGVLAYIRGEIKKKTREFEFHAISTNFGTKLSLRKLFFFNNPK
jgi:hypothetical protein